jgi:putative redox protein
MPKARVKWTQGMQFLGIAGSGHTAVVDAAEDSGGLNSAPRPTELLMIAEGGCTGMDVVSILRKMKADFTDFEMEINGETTAEHPRYVKKIHIIYKIWGQVSEENLKKAIELSLDKYCTVANTLKGKAEFSYDYQINPKRDT